MHIVVAIEIVLHIVLAFLFHVVLIRIIHNHKITHWKEVNAMTWLVEPTGDNDQVERTTGIPCGYLGLIGICLGTNILCADLCLCYSIPPSS